MRSNSKNSERNHSLNKTHIGGERPHSTTAEGSTMKLSRAPFIVYRTTSKDPKMVLSEIHKGLMINRISYKQVSGF